MVFVFLKFYRLQEITQSWRFPGTYEVEEPLWKLEMHGEKLSIRKFLVFSFLNQIFLMLLKAPK